MAGTMIRIARICYPVTVLGPGNRMGIWVSGCARNCPGCISPELQDPASGAECSVKQIRQLIEQLDQLPEGFTISGGEPFDQPEGLAELLEVLSEYSKDILIFSGYVYEELKNRNDPDTDRCLQQCSALIDGPFLLDQCDGSEGLRGSSNQNIHIFTFMPGYESLESQTCELQTFIYNNRLLTIGIPKKGDEDEQRYNTGSKE